MRLEYWKNKLRLFVPGWIFSQRGGNVSRLFDSFAVFFNSLEKNISDTVDQAFVDKATDGFLDQLAKEVGLVRFEGETDVQLRSRIKNLSANNDCETLRAAADAIIITNPGTTGATIYENNNLGFYVGSFAGDDTVIQDETVANSFTMVTRNLGSNLFNPLIETINARKAFGIGWKLWMRS